MEREQRLCGVERVGQLAHATLAVAKSVENCQSIVVGQRATQLGYVIRWCAAPSD